MKAIECSQHYTFIFRRSRAAYSVVDERFWQKFKLIIAFMVVLNDEDSAKNEGTRVSQQFSHYKTMGTFPDTQGQLTPQSQIGCWWILNLSEILYLYSLPAIMKKIR